MPSGKLQVIPLGGLGEFGMNCMAIRWADDIIVIDAEKGTLDVELSDAELAERRKAWKPKAAAFGSGALYRYSKNVGPARYGALTAPGAENEVRCYADI